MGLFIQIETTFLGCFVFRVLLVKISVLCDSYGVGTLEGVFHVEHVKVQKRNERGV